MTVFQLKWNLDYKTNTSVWCWRKSWLFFFCVSLSLCFDSVFSERWSRRCWNAATVSCGPNTPEQRPRLCRRLCNMSNTVCNPAPSPLISPINCCQNCDQVYALMYLSKLPTEGHFFSPQSKVVLSIFLVYLFVYAIFFFFLKDFLAFGA